MKSKPKRPRYPSDNLKRATITLEPELEKRVVKACKDLCCEPSKFLRLALISYLDEKWL